MKGAFKTQLELAAKVRREAGNCGPYATGEENDLIGYREVVDVINDFPEWGAEEIAKEASVPVDFVNKVRADFPAGYYAVLKQMKAERLPTQEIDSERVLEALAQGQSPEETIQAFRAEFDDMEGGQ